MRIFATLLLAICCRVFAADNPDEKDVIAVVQKLFDAMAAHDSEAARSVVMPDGNIVAVRDNGTVTAGTQEQFAVRLSTIKEPILERMWNPKVLIRGRIAQVWAEYDFYRGGKFGHCGVDSVSLAKTAEGWKISGIIYTVETTGCAPSPLGPPPG